jgi:hypothetical protein
MTAPYFVVDGFYGGRSRTSQLGSSCTTMVRRKAYRSCFALFGGGNV